MKKKKKLREYIRVVYVAGAGRGCPAVFSSNSPGVLTATSQTLEGVMQTRTNIPFCICTNFSQIIKQFRRIWISIPFRRSIGASIRTRRLTHSLSSRYHITSRGNKCLYSATVMNIQLKNDKSNKERLRKSTDN